MYLFIAEGEDYALKAGFTVSAKFFKKAVDRNRIKRITREAYRLQKATLEETLSHNKKSLDIFLLFTGKELPEFTLAKEKVGLILSKLINHANEKTVAGT